MRIKKLTMQSFGSYEEETVIDFDKISGRGIFLVSGDTERVQYLMPYSMLCMKNSVQREQVPREMISS